jgi:hypothetical protein
MLVFFRFMPIGIIVAGLIGAVGLGIVASRDDANTGSNTGSKGGPDPGVAEHRGA